MTTLQAILLGLVQGLGEFLPISSSGHLKLLEHFLGLPNSEEMFAFDVALHLATLVALVIYFRADLARVWGAWWRSVRRCGRPSDSAADARWAWLVLVAMVPTGLIAMGLKDKTAPLFERLWLVSVMLALAGCFNWFSHRRLRTERRQRTIGELNYGHALVCGCAQGLAAVFHGISRSGTTMAAGLLCGLGNEEAPRFSFLMAVPAVLAAALVEVPKLFRAGCPVGLRETAIACVVAGVAGYVAVWTVFRAVRRGRFEWFAWYCWGAAFVSLVLLLLGA
jgi:undecaprenyl-diphosphatase